MAGTRKEGFYWIGVGQGGPPEIARWTPEGWWLIGQEQPVQEEGIEVLSRRLRCRTLPDSPAGMRASLLFALCLCALAVLLRLDPGQVSASLGGTLLFAGAISGMVALDGLLHGSTS